MSCLPTITQSWYKIDTKSELPIPVSVLKVPTMLIVLFKKCVVVYMALCPQRWFMLNTLKLFFTLLSALQKREREREVECIHVLWPSREHLVSILRVRAVCKVPGESDICFIVTNRHGAWWWRILSTPSSSHCIRSLFFPLSLCLSLKLFRDFLRDGRVFNGVLQNLGCIND